MILSYSFCFLCLWSFHNIWSEKVYFFQLISESVAMFNQNVSTTYMCHCIAIINICIICVNCFMDIVTKSLLLQEAVFLIIYYVFARCMGYQKYWLNLAKNSNYLYFSIVIFIKYIRMQHVCQLFIYLFSLDYKTPSLFVT